MPCSILKGHEALAGRLASQMPQIEDDSQSRGCVMALPTFLGTRARVNPQLKTK